MPQGVILLRALGGWLAGCSLSCAFEVNPKKSDDCYQEHVSGDTTQFGLTVWSNCSELKKPEKTLHRIEREPFSHYGEAVRERVGNRERVCKD